MHRFKDRNCRFHRLSPLCSPFLCPQVINYAGFREVNVLLIWDAMGRDPVLCMLPSVDKRFGFEEHFATAMTADTYIFGQVDAAFDQGVRQCVVVSSDFEVQIFSRQFTAESVATVLSSEELLRDLVRAKMEQNTAMRRLQEQSRAKMKRGGEMGGNPFAALGGVREQIVRKEREENGEEEIPEWMRKYLQ